MRQLIRLLIFIKMKKLLVDTKSQKYPIIIGNNLISNISKIISKNSISFKKCLLVVDRNVPKKKINLAVKKIIRQFNVSRREKLKFQALFKLTFSSRPRLQKPPRLLEASTIVGAATLLKPPEAFSYLQCISKTSRLEASTRIEASTLYFFPPILVLSFA